MSYLKKRHSKQGNFLRKIYQCYLDLKIIWKLIIGFGLVLLTAFFIAGVSQYHINKMNDNFGSIIDDELVPLAYLADIRSYISELEVTTKDALLNKDQAALNYVRNEYLPKTVRVTVDYSFKQLIDNLTGAKTRPQRNHWFSGFIKYTNSSDRRMANETVQVLKELQDYWHGYDEVYRNMLENPSLASEPAFMKEEKRLRYFLVGGIDRLVETHYRQQAIIAKTQAEEAFKQQQIFTGVLLAVAIALAVIVSAVTAWFIVSPLIRMANAARKTAAGELSVSLPENRRDELGDVAQCFNIMIHELTSLIERIQVAADNVHENSQKLLDGTSNANAATQQLVETLSQVAIGAGTQQQRVTSIYDAIKAVADFSQMLHEVINRVAELSSDSVAKAIAGEDVAGQAAAKMKSVQQFMVISNEMMVNLQTLSSEVGGMVLTVKEIGEQINLLSLNATIEAARAGKAGRGFSVVAESIGELAERTKKATSQVQNLVNRIQQTFTKLSAMIESENTAMVEGEQAVRDLHTLFEAIIEGAKRVDLELGEVNKSTMKLTEEQSEVLKAVGQITDIALQHKTGTEQASNVAEEHYCFTQEIISSSQILAHWGDNLLQAVNKFKIQSEKKIRPVS
jgi:methyl-accepting chemotaxis protein